MDGTMQTDRELVELTLSGSKEAFGVLYDRYFEYVISVLRGRACRMGLAKDLAQESFLQAYLCLRHLRKPGSFKSWLHGIALNVHREHLREKDASHASFEAVTGGCSADAFLPSARIVDPQEMVERTELRQIILKAVNSLSPGVRQPVLLFYYERLRLEEIALRMGLSGSAVKSRLHRGRLYLKEILYRLFVEYSFEHYLKVWRRKMVKVSIFDVVKEESSGRHSVTLIDDARKTIVPIIIGDSQAFSIANALMKREMPRPMTFDLVANLLQAANVEVLEVRVESLIEGTFYSVIKVKTNSEEKEVDARPSDAIALALRMDSPIYVSDEVMGKAGYKIHEEDLAGKTTIEGYKDIQNTIETVLSKLISGAASFSLKSLLTKE